MATAYIRMGGVMGGNAPVYAAIPRATQDITTSATHAVSTIAANAGDYLRVVASGGNIRIAIGATPVAETGKGDIVLAGTSLDLGPLSQGDKVSVIDAA